MLVENVSSLTRINGFISQLPINYTEDWTSEDVYYYTFIKAEKRHEKLQDKSSLVLFPPCQESPSLASSRQIQTRLLWSLKVPPMAPGSEAWLLSPSLTESHFLLYGVLSCLPTLSIPTDKSSRNWHDIQDSQHWYSPIHPLLTPPRRPQGPVPSSHKCGPHFGKLAPPSSGDLRVTLLGGSEGALKPGKGVTRKTMNAPKTNWGS